MKILFSLFVFVAFLFLIATFALPQLFRIFSTTFSSCFSAFYDP